MLFGNFGIRKLEFGIFQIGNLFCLEIGCIKSKISYLFYFESLNFLNFEKLDFRNMHQKLMNNPVKNLRNLGYEFHIYQKHEMAIW